MINKSQIIFGIAIALAIAGGVYAQTQEELNKYLNPKRYNIIPLSE